MILRLSQNLNKKIKAGKLETVPLDENPYADWSCHLFTANRTQYILLSNTKSLYSCLMYGRGVTDSSRFIERASSTIREFTEADGQESVYGKFIAPVSETVHLAKTLNRTVTRAINGLITISKILLDDQEDTSLHDVGLRLNNLLSSTAASRGHPNRGRLSFNVNDNFDGGEERD